MSKEPALNDTGKDVKSTSSQWACFQRYKILYSLFLMAGLFAFIGLFCYYLWFLPHANTQDITYLKNQTASLSRRIEQLEIAEKTDPLSTFNPEQLRSFETRLTTLQQQIESLQIQLKTEASPQPNERSKIFENSLSQVTQIQETLRSILLFWRLQAKILAGDPYALELADFKIMTKNLPDLSALEKYANSGLIVLQETPIDSSYFVENSPTSWWERLKVTAKSFVKIEKVGAINPSFPLPDQQIIKDLLAQLDQSLIQQLKTLSLSLSSQPGDAL